MKAGLFGTRWHSLTFRDTACPRPLNPKVQGSTPCASTNLLYEHHHVGPPRRQRIEESLLDAPAKRDSGKVAHSLQPAACCVEKDASAGTRLRATYPCAISIREGT